MNWRNKLTVGEHCSMQKSFVIFISVSCYDFLYCVQVARTALHRAAESESEGKEKLKVLLENGADCNVQDQVRFF